MHGSRLPVPPRQSAWSGSKENLGHYSDNNNIVGSEKHTKATQNGTEGVLSDTRGPATHQVHAGHRYSAHSQFQRLDHGSPPAHQTARQTVGKPILGQNISPTDKNPVKQAANVTAAAVCNKNPPIHKASGDVVSSVQPALRTCDGFRPNSSFPSSYVGMPASTAGITIGPPKGESKIRK